MDARTRALGDGRDLSLRADVRGDGLARSEPADRSRGLAAPTDARHAGGALSATVDLARSGDGAPTTPRRRYYHHEALGLTQWELPTDEPARPSEQPVDDDHSRAVEAPDDASRHSFEQQAPASAPSPGPKRQSGAPPKRNKDYLALADAYRLEKQYRELEGRPTCVMCHRRPCEDVLFPCEHKCVCRACLRTNGIGESREEGKWCLCPLCCGEIKRIFPHDGSEVKRYWNWVLEARAGAELSVSDEARFGLMLAAAGPRSYAL